MKLSKALLSGKIKFIIRDNPDKPGTKQFRPFGGAVEEAFPEVAGDMDRRHAMFPLAFCFPLFSVIEKPACVWELLPSPEDGGPPRTPANIFFICDVIDSLSVGKGWSEQQVGELILKIEEALEEHGLTPYGALKGRAA